MWWYGWDRVKFWRLLGLSWRQIHHSQHSHFLAVRVKRCCHQKNLGIKRDRHSGQVWELTWIFPLSFSSPDVSKFQTHCFHLFLSPSSPRSPFWPEGPTSPFMPSLPSRPGIPWEEGTPGTPGVPGVPGGPAGPWIGHVTMHELSHCLWKKAENGFTCRYS